jgi:hypothetical protein
MGPRATRSSIAMEIWLTNHRPEESDYAPLGKHRMRRDSAPLPTHIFQRRLSKKNNGAILPRSCRPVITVTMNLLLAEIARNHAPNLHLSSSSNRRLGTCRGASPRCRTLPLSAPAEVSKTLQFMRDNAFSSAPQIMLVGHCFTGSSLTPRRIISIGLGQ